MEEVIFFKHLSLWICDVMRIHKGLLFCAAATQQHFEQMYAQIDFLFGDHQ